MRTLSVHRRRERWGSGFVTEEGDEEVEYLSVGLRNFDAAGDMVLRDCRVRNH